MQVKIYRTYLVSYTGRHGIESWIQIDGKPEVDNKDFFYTFEEAHETLINKFENWLKEQKARLSQLKILNTEKAFVSDITCNSNTRFTETF